MLLAVATATAGTHLLEASLARTSSNPLVNLYAYRGLVTRRYLATATAGTHLLEASLARIRAEPRRVLPKRVIPLLLRSGLPVFPTCVSICTFLLVQQVN